MNCLIINIDKSIFEPNSKSLERLQEYSQFCEKLFVIVFTLKKYETPRLRSGQVPQLRSGQAPQLRSEQVPQLRSGQAIKIGNLTVLPTNSKNKISYFKDALSLAKKVINEEKINLVMTQDPFDTGIIGWLLKRKFKIPWQCQVHTDFLSPYFKKESFINKLRVIVGKFLIKKADNIRAVSERVKNSLLKIGLSDKKIFVLPILSDIEAIIKAPIKTDLHKKYPQFENIILTASRLSKEKNIGLIIKAMQAVLKNYPETGLIIVGNGPEKDNLKLQTINYKLQTNIVFEPWTEDLISYYKTADIFVLASNYEGWSMTIIEAAASECPIIMTDVGCADEIIKNGESGVIVPVKGQKSLELSIIKLLGNKILQKKLAENAKKALLKLPSQERYLEIYKKSWEALSATDSTD